MVGSEVVQLFKKTEWVFVIAAITAIAAIAAIAAISAIITAIIMAIIMAIITAIMIATPFANIALMAPFIRITPSIPIRPNAHCLPIERAPGRSSSRDRGLS